VTVGIAWGSLFIVCVISLAVGVAIVALVAFALVGLAIAGVCLLAAAAIVGYGLWIIVA
jgi:hypothetical protein